MQISRLFEIVYLLMDKKSVTASELAARFEVSKRTILRDIDRLTAAGIPVYTSQGRGGGISLLDRFVLNKAVVSESEQQQILFALKSMSAAGQMETESVLSRLQSLFARSDKDWIEVDFSRWGNSKADRAKFGLLKDAVMNERAISFTYYGSYGTTADRRAYPLKLVFKSSSWYLQAFCLLKNDFRLFKISRMLNVSMLDDTFDGGAFQLPEIDPFVYEPLRLISVELRFEPYAAYRVYDEFDGRYITQNDDGSLGVSVSLPDDHWLYEYILSFGPAVEAIAPQSVRDELARLAEKIKTRYSANT